MIKINEDYTDFKNVKFPIKWKDKGHEFEVTKPAPGRFGLKVDGEGMMSGTSPYDVNDYLKYYKTEIPGTYHHTFK